MHTGRRYSTIEFLNWTRKDIYWMIVLAFIPTLLFELGLKFLTLPWPPIAILGTAVAFTVGFKNNASYGRVWEARQIYGSVINDSRSFAYTLRDVLKGKQPETVKKIFYRHFAWLTALRYQLREPRTWENMSRQENREFQKGRFVIPEREISLEAEIKLYLSDDEVKYILPKKNKTTQLSAMQSEELETLRNTGMINDFQWTTLQNCLIRLTENQGKAERIKNFPYPRNFSSTTTVLLFIFILAVPFGLLKDLDKLGDGTMLEGFSIWFNIPFSVITVWAFHTLDKVGEVSINPFEGNANDVPISQISRSIEIDMRDMLDEQNLPSPLRPENNILL